MALSVVFNRRVQGYGRHVPKGAKSLGRARPNNIIYSDESTLMHIRLAVLNNFWCVLAFSFGEVFCVMGTSPMLRINLSGIRQNKTLKWPTRL